MNTEETILVGSLGAAIGLYGVYKIFFSGDEEMTKSEREEIMSRPRFGNDGQYIDYSGRGITKRKRKHHKKSHKKRK
jgi:ribosomal 30S subunit maturation factor RimM